MNYVTCNLCGRDDWTVRFPATLQGPEELDVGAFRCTSASYGRHAQIVQCRHCGHVYANPRWQQARLLEAYSQVEDETYASERQGRELTFRRHLRAMERVTGPAAGRSLLDVGAYIGVFLEIAAEAGWAACGVEPSEWAVRLARKHGLDVLAGTQDAPALQGRQFDVVTMWDVIEHVDDPRCEMEKAFRLLRPGGWLVIHTMDIDSLAARLMGRRWPWLMAMHIHYFSQKTMALMLRQAGFTVVWSGAQGRYLRLGYLASRVGGLSAPLGRLLARLVAAFGLSQVAVPLNFGDLFTVYARRPAEGQD